MRALIVAGAAALAGIVGVVGLTGAMADGSAPSASAVQAPLTATGPAPALDDRLARVERAERLADAALARGLARRGDGSVDDTQAGRHVGGRDDRHDDDRAGESDHDDDRDDRDDDRDDHDDDHDERDDHEDDD